MKDTATNDAVKKVLLLFSPQDTGVEEPIRRAFARADVMVDRETTLKPLAERLRANGYDYVVSGLHLAKDEDSALLGDGGLTACAEVRRAKPEVPIALIVPRINNEVQLRAASFAPPPLLLSAEDGLGEALVDQLRTLKARPRRLEIIICSADSGRWEYEMHGKGFTFHEHGLLNTNAELIEAQKNWSESILNGP